MVEKQGNKVLVAMSGGVDSSVTAALLKNQGYEVIGIHMQLWDHGKANKERFGGRCCSLVDSNDARRVCDKLDVPYYVINAQEVFKEKVVDYFVHEYLQNRTPNPCVECNNQIKFNYLFYKADELGCDWIATGHYAQVNRSSAESDASLRRATDPQKDQSYFLFGLTQKALRRTLMPLGGLSKLHVRKLAAEYDLPVAEKPDSQEICFIDDEGYKPFIENRVAPSFRPRGTIKNLDGTVVGDHEGLYRYTIGQKKGLRLIADLKAEYYVIGFDQSNHSLIVGPESALFHKELRASKMNWIHPDLAASYKGIHCKAKIRSRHDAASCLVTVFENDQVHVQFEDAQRAITPGQAIVLYDGDAVLGGGFIDQVIKA